MARAEHHDDFITRLRDRNPFCENLGIAFVPAGIELRARLTLPIAEPEQSVVQIHIPSDRMVRTAFLRDLLQQRLLALSNRLFRRVSGHGCAQSRQIPDAAMPGGSVLPRS